jgi:hypothetical protein
MAIARLAAGVVTTVLLILTFASPRAADILFPFYLPWDDDAETIIDLSGLLPKPAGEQGFVRATPDGQLVTDAGRIRFWGTNATFAASFPEKAEAERIARRLAKFGVNLLRFHHMDNQSVLDRRNGIWKTTRPDRELDPEQLDRLDYFIYQLKQRGIYTNLNLLVSRPFNRSGDDLPAALDAVTDWKVRAVLGFFDPRMLELQQQYARDLLTHVNPYTGRAHIDEPAIAVIEINNENGLVQAYLSRQVDALPAHYRDQLGGRWNDWLRRRYASHDDLLRAWNIVSEQTGAEMLTNGDFRSGSTSPWVGERHEGAAATFAVSNEGPSGERALRVSITNTGSAGWHVQLNHPGLTVESGRPYAVSFKARASAARRITVDCGMAVSPWSGLGFTGDVNLTSDWQTFTFTFTPSRSFSPARINFSNMGLQTGTIWFAEISLRPGGTLGLYPDETLNDGIRPFLLQGETIGRTVDGRRDWFRFLLETEEAYWIAMRDFVKGALGAKSPVVGTVIGTSTPNLMARFDVVDTHAYWRHPEFPRQPWSSTDWYVRNDAMVNAAPSASTIASLGLRRVLNKPHLVTEYNHSAPNTFEAEAFLFLAAYGALQDFDGLLPFDYQSSQSWDDRRTAGYFAVSQNPVKMASFIPAAAAFLRGDIAPARDRIVVSIPREDEVNQLLTSAAWRLVDAGTAGVNAADALRHRVAIAVEGQSAGYRNVVQGFSAAAAALKGCTTCANAIESSDTDQIRWDTSIPNRGVVVVDTPRSKWVFGFGGDRTFDLDGVRIQPGASLQNGFSAIALTALDGHPVTTARRLIVTALGATTNTNARWMEYPSTPLTFPPSEGTRITLRNDWGAAPSQVEGISATIALRGAGGRVRVWALDHRGARALDVSVSANGSGAEFTLGPEHHALWYEVEVNR